jgi:hypothetical protein
MLAIDQAKQMYAAKGLNLAEDIGRHLDCGGLVHVEPERLLIGRPLELANPDRWPAAGAADAWYITLAIGRSCLAEFVRQMPYFLPSLAWRRGFRGDHRLRVHDTARFIKFNRR